MANNVTSSSNVIKLSPSGEVIMIAIDLNRATEYVLKEGVQVEILIKSYLSFSMACNVIGTNIVLSIVRSRAQVSQHQDF